MIVPGQRIGPISLGMGMDTVLATLGKPSWSFINNGDPTKIGTEFDYNSLDMEIYFSSGAAPAVTGISVVANPRTRMEIGKIVWSDIGPFNDVFSTTQGTRLGSSSFDAARTYGAYEDQSGILMTYKQLGMGFSVTRDYRIWRISVVPAGSR